MYKTDLPGVMQHSLARTLQNWFQARVMDVQADGSLEQQPMEIFVKDLCGRTLTFYVYRNTTIQV